MTEKDYEAERRFYEVCAEVLGVAHSYKPFPPKKRNRWTNREAGNGRFDGKGCIRMFAPNCIHVMLVSPRLNKQFSSCEAAIDAIKNALKVA